MGTFGTWCQLCGLPVQHTHLVPEEAPGRYRIYRGLQTLDGDLAPAVPLGPEHEWLKRAVALALDDDAEPAMIAGEVQDGDLEGAEGTASVGDGIDLSVAAHRACWERAGKPTGSQVLDHIRSPLDPVLTRYQRQLFDLAGLVRDGHGWMLADPDGTGEDAVRSRARIDALVGALKDLRTR